MRVSWASGMRQGTRWDLFAARLGNRRLPGSEWTRARVQSHRRPIPAAGGRAGRHFAWRDSLSDCSTADADRVMSYAVVIIVGDSPGPSETVKGRGAPVANV